MITAVKRKQHNVAGKPLKSNSTYCCFTKDLWFYFNRFFPEETSIIGSDNFFKLDNYHYLDIKKIKEIPGHFSSEAWKVILKNLVVKPSDCFFAFGIPTGKHLGSLWVSEFNEMNSDYMKKAERPGSYSERVLKPVSSFIKFIKKLGVIVKENLTLNEFTTCFKKNYLAVFLFTHFIDKNNKTYNTKEEDGVELGMKFVSSGDLVNAVPKEYTNTFDLCVCTVLPVAMLLKKQRPDCSIRYLDKEEAHPSEWMLFYKCLFTLLDNKPLSYRAAASETKQYIKKYIQSKSKIKEKV